MKFCLGLVIFKLSSIALFVAGAFHKAMSKGTMCPEEKRKKKEKTQRFTIRSII